MNPVVVTERIDRLPVTVAVRGPAPTRRYYGWKESRDHTVRWRIGGIHRQWLAATYPGPKRDVDMAREAMAWQLAGERRLARIFRGDV